jgi:hypothetical protein
MLARKGFIRKRDMPVKKDGGTGLGKTGRHVRVIQIPLANG